GGDILYRWGNPVSYGGGAPEDQKLFEQHDAHWIGTGLPGEGNLLVFSNGPSRPEGVYSTIEEIVPEVDGGGNYTLPGPGIPFGPAAATWTHIADPPTSLYSPGISGSQRLYNGNTLICEGTYGRFLEVKPDGTIVWEYRMPLSAGVPIVQGEEQGNTAVFRCYRYRADYPGLAGRDLSPGGFIEIYPVSISSSQYLPATPAEGDDVLVTAIITDDVQVAVAEVWVDVGSGFSAQPMYDDGTNGDVLAGDDMFSAIIPSQVEATEVAYYIVAEDDGANSASDPPNGPLTTYRYTVETICPGTTEIWYDGVDQDCDGLNDFDADMDGYVDEAYPAEAGGSAPGLGDCNDNAAAIYPGAPEIPGDGIDQNCDGSDPCCIGRVGNANGTGEYPDEVTLGDIMLMVDVLFISNDCTKFACPDEVDVNQSGGANPPQALCLDYVSLGDIMTLVDFLFITGPETATLKDCL
ncbi:MAG: putative metal-binding motif-containing protein, partial [Thermoplasmata archaeon]|nr:putative metal-binding motif-containing protein [Thermoplasmata archaeon]